MTFLFTFGIIVVAFLGVAFGLGAIFSTPGYRGPDSDHFNGRQFINPNGAKAKSIKDILKWIPNRNQGPWKKVDQMERGPEFADFVNSGLKVTFINHSSFLIQIDGFNILIDPVFSKRASPVSFAGPKRMRPPGLSITQLPQIHLILLSHNHYDHLDLPAIKQLKNTFNPEFIVPLGVKVFLERNGFSKCHELDWWEKWTSDTGFAITSTQAQHFSGRGMLDRDKSLWCGYAIQGKYKQILFVGDTGYGDFFKAFPQKIGIVDLAIIPIGAYKPRWFMHPIHCSPQEAVQIHLDLQSRLSVPCHFGTFPMADDGMTEPLDELKFCLGELNLESAFQMLKEGESLSVS